MKKIPEKWDNWKTTLQIIVLDLLRRAKESRRMEEVSDIFVAVIILNPEKIKPFETKHFVFEFKDKLIVKPKTKKGKEVCQDFFDFVRKVAENKEHPKVSENIGFLSFLKHIEEIKMTETALEIEFIKIGEDGGK